MTTEAAIEMMTTKLDSKPAPTTRATVADSKKGKGTPTPRQRAKQRGYSAFVDRARGIIGFSPYAASNLTTRVDNEDWKYFDPDETRDAATDGYIEVEVDELKAATLITLLNDRQISAWVRDELREMLRGKAPERIGSPQEAHFALLGLQAEKLQPENREDALPLFIEVAGLPAMVSLTVESVTYMGQTVVFTIAAFKLGDKVQSVDGRIDEDFFLKDGVRRTVTLDEMLAELNLRVGAKEERVAYEQKVREARAISKQVGKVLASSGPGLVWREVAWFKLVQAVDLGTKDRPYQVVVEPTLETVENTYKRKGDQDTPEMPYIRVFDFKSRQFLYASLEHVVEYEFDDDAMDKLSIDQGPRDALDKIFALGNRADAVADIVRGKHGGVIILAEGPPGVGKTMTAEVIAQKTHRPLYTISLSDLGTYLEDVTKNLDRLLIRAERWNALLLIDEADVLMSRRGEDLERSAIVSLFLHRIEYYHGFLFLTTNRPEVIDSAVLDRVTMRIRYGALTPEKRVSIWTNLLKNAQITVNGDIARLASINIDGRRIRNTVRLVNLMYKAGSTVDATEIIQIALENKAA
jgi:hypothetical protein